MLGIVHAVQGSSQARAGPCPGKMNQQAQEGDTMEGTIIDRAVGKLEWLLAHPDVTWSGSGIYALSLLVSAAVAVAVYLRQRKKKSSAGGTFTCKGGEQNIAQGDHPVGKQINRHGSVLSTSEKQSPAIQGRDVTLNYNNVSPEVLADVRKLAVTESALANFFRILEEQQVARGELDAKLREIAMRHVELLQRFESVTSDDPEVKALKKEAGQAIKNGEYDRAEDLLNQAKERDRDAIARMKASIAEQQAALEKRQLSEAASCVEQAKLQEMQYRYEKAAQYFQEAAAALPEGHEWEQATYLRAAGYDLWRIASYAKALPLYEQSLSISRKIGYRKQEGIMLNNISQIYQAQGDYSKALEYLEQSLPICQEVGDNKCQGATLNNIAMIYQAKGNYPQALKYLEQSLLLQREIHEREGEGATLNNIGMIYHAQGDFTTTLRYYKQALTVAREIKDKALESKVLNNIGQVYYAQENYDVALKYAEQSLAIRQQIGDRQGESTSLNNIGLIDEAKGDYSTALKQYEQSLAITLEIGDKAGEAGSNWNIGRLYEDQGEPFKAEPYLSWAVELAEQLEHPKLEEWREVLEEVRTKLREQGN